MKYTKGRIGRVLLVKFEDDDILLDEIKDLAKREKVKAATLIFLGALKKGTLVTGPKNPVIPPQPNKVNFKDGWEVMGIGTIFSNKSGPQVHIHSSMGRKNKVLIGCVRGESRVFLVVEAIIFELKGVKTAKSPDPVTGLNLLRIF